ncbi:MAG: Gfo/Idh/MocA family oxidoreductase [Bacteroidales bacterium]|nr:Gfo/Idh/MocA family oxidoreductase [Bacteroidales bacterium]
MITNRDNPIRVAVIGAGVRGTSLARKLTSSSLSAVIKAVAEPDEEKRNSFVQEFGLPADAAFSDWAHLTEKFDQCDAAIIATLDNQHAGPAVACLNRGWHILLEKPLADKFSDCKLIVKTHEERKKVVAVCHTLRFMEGFRKVKQTLELGTIGKLIHVEHMEAIGNLRFAHNYVRGRWSAEKENTFLLLHKCSHDIDYINWLFSEPCLRVSSFGSLKYFTSANAPYESTSRCTDGCPLNDTCHYSAYKLYVDTNLEEWPARDICRIHTRDEHLNAVKNGPYGVCVWHAGNDVVDHQVVMMEFDGGATATCTLSGYSATNGRRIRLQGTQGELLFDEAAGTISTKKFTGNEEEIVRITAPLSYHPEDQEIVDEWLSSIIHSTSVTVDAGEALRTHAVVFAAEISRNEKRTVEMSELIG